LLFRIEDRHDSLPAVSGPGTGSSNEASILLHLVEFVELVPEKPLESFNPNKKESITAVGIILRRGVPHFHHNLCCWCC